MRRTSTFVLAVAVAACSSARQSGPPAAAQGAGASAASSAVQAAATDTPTRDSVAMERERYVADLRRQIAGRETQPASQVFKNLKTMGDMPAARLLGVMNMGYGKSLGVSCTHCHVAGAWDSDEKPQKQVARDMAAMAGRINNELLKGIPNLKGPNAIVNCTTCHRGQVKPALNMP